MRAATAIPALFLAASLYGGCAPGVESYDVTGTIVSVYAEQHILKIDHDEIPGFMPAMSMNFDVEAGTI